MLNIRPVAAEFFSPFFKTRADGTMVFQYGKTAFESWIPGSNLIPSTQDIWLAGGDCPALITDLYIGYSAADLVCFASQRTHDLLRHPEQQAFAALGLLPTAKQIEQLQNSFPNARWHLLFPADLLGKIADACIAAWFKGYAVFFRVNNDRITVKFRGQVFQLDSQIFSLHHFELASGMRSGIRTHKPPSGYNSFIALQQRIVTCTMSEADKPPANRRHCKFFNH